MADKIHTEIMHVYVAMSPWTRAWRLIGTKIEIDNGNTSHTHTAWPIILVGLSARHRTVR